MAHGHDSVDKLVDARRDAADLLADGLRLPAEGISHGDIIRVRKQPILTCHTCGFEYRESEHVIVDRDEGLCPGCAAAG